MKDFSDHLVSEIITDSDGYSIRRNGLSDYVCLYLEINLLIITRSDIMMKSHIIVVIMVVIIQVIYQEI